jgi:hypothetical protein
MESAAALANSFNKLVKAMRGQKASFDSIKGVLIEYQKGRKHRADFLVDTTNDLTRVEAVASFKHESMAKLTPMMGDLLVDKACMSLSPIFTLLCGHVAYFHQAELPLLQRLLIFYLSHFVLWRQRCRLTPKQESVNLQVPFDAL